MENNISLTEKKKLTKLYYLTIYILSILISLPKANSCVKVNMNTHTHVYSHTHIFIN